MKHALWLPLVGAVTLAACAKKPPETPDQHDEVAVEKNLPKPKATDKDDDSLAATGEIDDKIRKMCDLPEARFELNSASLGAQAKGMLDKLATCFKSGPGKGKTMNIVGHADPRGETEYNTALGQRRAGAVGAYLKGVGLGDDRAPSSSRGELDATGTDEAGWAKDRRVEILLAQ